MNSIRNFIIKKLGWLVRTSRSISILKMMTIIAALFLILSIGSGAASLIGLNHLKDSITSSKDEIVQPMLSLRKFDEIVADIPYRMLLFVSDQYPAVGTINKLNESNKKLLEEWGAFKGAYPASKKEKKIISAIDQALGDLPEFNKSLNAALNAEDMDLVAELFEDEWPDFQIELTNNSHIFLFNW